MFVVLSISDPPLKLPFEEVVLKKSVPITYRRSVHALERVAPFGRQCWSSFGCDSAVGPLPGLAGALFAGRGELKVFRLDQFV